MFNIVIVDDEPLVSLTIKSIVNWEEYGINISFEASNGEEALEFINVNDVDIVITDLNMPVMDGLELINNIKDKDITVVVLSAYEDYELVRKSFKLGVNDYILKSDIDEDKLKEVILPIVDGIRKNKNIEEQVEEEDKIIKESLLKSILSGVINTKEVESVLKYKDNTGTKAFVLIYLTLDNQRDIKNRHENDIERFISLTLNALRSVDSHKNYEALSFSYKDYIIVYSLSDKNKLEYNIKIKKFIKRLQENIRGYINISFSIGVSDITFSLKEGRRAFLEAKECSEYKFIKGKNSVTYYNEIYNGKFSLDHIRMKINNFTESLTEGDRSTRNKELENIFMNIRECEFSLEKRYSSYSELILALNKVNKDILNEFGLETNNIYDFIDDFETYYELEKWIKKSVNKIIEMSLFKKNKEYSYTITRAIEFIDNNYFKYDMSIGSVSNHVELSESYFSVLFSTECGESFTDYLIRFRVEKAKELIETSNLKIYEICEAVGYRNVEHFSRIFKKITGVSPNGYKHKKSNEKSIKSIKHHSIEVK